MSKTIDFEIQDNSLLLVYRPRDGTDWLKEKLTGTHTYTIKKTFTVRRKNISEPLKKQDGRALLESSEFLIKFRLAKLVGNYWNFDKEVLGIPLELRIHSSLNLNVKYFIAVNDISVFYRISELVESKSLTIGGETGDEEWLSEDDFNHLVSTFPNSYELKKYANARMSSVLRERFQMKRDDEALYHKYINNKTAARRRSNAFFGIEKYEYEKYKDLHSHLIKMLEDENQYSEREWQNEIVQFILLLFPKYLYAFTEAPVLDGQYEKVRSLDFLLIDFSGNTDIVEIKKPFEKGLVTQSGYRDNYIPRRELSGTVMQIEKYIFHLMKSGRAGEKKLNDKYGNDVHDGFKIRITNPKGMIISGRTNNLSENQMNDFEVVKRKYNNIVDILSYDDLLNRLEHIINRLSQKM
ncbi:Shedu immune nuclease family protein [Leucothrix mucor]|uniref:Shedu immune nuclease family protein n=1 Tax=Leucothrix mucor TaxID=45248 RepID=UPI0003B7B390|nr:Shedu immune nuclease family protein [Leucothrix mucor]